MSSIDFWYKFAINPPAIIAIILYITGLGYGILPEKYLLATILIFASGIILLIKAILAMHFDLQFVYLLTGGYVLFMGFLHLIGLYSKKTPWQKNII